MHLSAPQNLGAINKEKIEEKRIFRIFIKAIYKYQKTCYNSLTLLNRVKLWRGDHMLGEILYSL